jgi:Transglycosylase SLT domain
VPATKPLLNSVQSQAQPPVRTDSPFAALFTQAEQAELKDYARQSDQAANDQAAQDPSENDMQIQQYGRRTILKWVWRSVLLALMFVCVVVVLVTIPITQAWLHGYKDMPFVQSIWSLIDPNGSGLEKARVADQFDLARSEPIQLSKDDSKVAIFFAKKYRLAPSQIERYLSFAQTAAKAKGLDPALVMAVMSIESNFNPITESPVGAQGLMQVLTAVHLDKLSPYGGALRVFEPEINILVGTTILADCIKLGGSLEMGLKCYVGATGPTDNGYGAKVLAEKDRIEKARLGVFDFSPNNKILIEMGLISAAAGVATSSTDLNALNAINSGASTSAYAPPGAAALSTASPMTVPPVAPAPVQNP